MNEFLLIMGMAVVTFAVRYPVLMLIGKLPMPDGLFRALKYVPAAVLTAIIVPGMLMPEGTIDISLTNTYLIAGIASGVVAWRTKNVLVTIIVGMALFLILRFVIIGM